MKKITKTTASHSTVTSAAQKIIDFAGKLPEVTKIGIGYITHVRGGRRDIKFLSIVGGIKAMIRGSGAVQELYIYTDDPSLTAQKILQQFK